MSALHRSRRRFLLHGTAALAALPLTACGFKLRGPRALPFSTIYIHGSDPNSPLFGKLSRQILANGNVEIVSKAEEADVQLMIMGISPDREILSLSGDGHVREYELFLTLNFKVLDRNNQELIPPTTIAARRDYSFQDQYVIAKEEEEVLLFKDMEQDVMDQLFRRLAAIQR